MPEMVEGFFMRTTIQSYGGKYHEVVLHFVSGVTQYKSHMLEKSTLYE